MRTLRRTSGSGLLVAVALLSSCSSGAKPVTVGPPSSTPTTTHVQPLVPGVPLFGRVSQTGVHINARLLHLGCADMLMAQLTENGQQSSLGGLAPMSARAEREHVLLLDSSSPVGVAVHVGPQVTKVSWTDTSGRTDQMAPVDGWAVLATQAQATSLQKVGTTVTASNASGVVASLHVPVPQLPQLGSAPQVTPDDC